MDDPCDPHHLQQSIIDARPPIATVDLCPPKVSAWTPTTHTHTHTHTHTRAGLRRLFFHHFVWVCVCVCVCMCVTWGYWGRSVPLCWAGGRSESPPEAAARCGDSWCKWSSEDQPSRTLLYYGTWNNNKVHFFGCVCVWGRSSEVLVITGGGRSEGQRLEGRVEDVRVEQEAEPVPDSEASCVCYCWFHGVWHVVLKVKVPAGELIRLVLSGRVEVQAELGVDAQTEVVVHLDNLRQQSRVLLYLQLSTTWPFLYTCGCLVQFISIWCCLTLNQTLGGSRKPLSCPSSDMSWASSRMVHRSIRTSSASSTETRMWWGSSPL